MKKNIIPRLTVFLLTIALFASLLCMSSFADVIFEPDDSFYGRYSDEFNYVNRPYYANGESGWLEYFEEPNGRSEGFIPNGEILHVEFEYTDSEGVVWALDYYSRYFRQQELVEVYDSNSFYEDHEDEIWKYHGNASEFAGLKNVVFWTFPRSGEYITIFESELDDGFSPSSVYTDNEGYEWCYVNYYYGIRDAWICIAEPDNPNIPGDPPPMPVLYERTSDTPPKPSTSGIPPVILAIMLVGVVILITIVLIRIIYLRKSEK